MTEAKELHINAKGEAIFKDPPDAATQSLSNPFMRLSDDLIEHWDPSTTERAPRTWQSTLGAGGGAADIDPKEKQELFLQDFLNALLPPIPTKIITANCDGNVAEATAYSLVSTEQTKRSEISNIGDEFNELVQQRRARKVGLDDIRHQLSFQLFDEMVRQIAIDCKERGLLLLRIRDEAKVTLDSYKLLNTISSTYVHSEQLIHSFTLCLSIISALTTKWTGSRQTKGRKAILDLMSSSSTNMSCWRGRES